MIFSEMAKQVRKVPSLTYSNIQGVKPNIFVNYLALSLTKCKEMHITNASIYILTKPGFFTHCKKFFLSPLYRDIQSAKRNRK